MTRKAPKLVSVFVRIYRAAHGFYTRSHRKDVTAAPAHTPEA